MPAVPATAAPAARSADHGRGEARAAFLYVPTGARARPMVLDRLARLGLPFAAATDPAHASRLLAGRPVPLALIDLAGDRAALVAIRMIRSSHPNVSVVGIVDPASPVLSAEAVHAGVLDLLPWPFDERDVLTALANARDLVVTASADGPDRTKGADAARRLVAQSSAMRAVLDRVRAAASTRTSVLVCGEPGSGRATVARDVHEQGRVGDHPVAAGGPWIVEDCARGTPDDIDRRLFGTPAGVAARRPGARAAGFECIARGAAVYAARGGTLFLQNVTEAPARVQARLARLLRDHDVEIIEQPGTLVDLDIRVIGSAGPDVDEAVRDGRLRADLYERLAQTRIDLPPLRARRDDVPALAVGLLRRACDAHAVPQKGISRAALKLLAALPWRGNATELDALIATLVRAVDRPVIQLDDILEHASFDAAAVRLDAGVSLREAKAQFERECIGAVLERHQGRVGDAAKALGIQRTNLYRKVRQLHVARPRQVRRSEQ